MVDSDCDINATRAIHSYWIYEGFGDCVVNGRQYFAFFVGLLSLIAWICAQLPQLVVNCKTGRSDKSLSFWFLLLWLFSDFANFLGAILTDQVIIVILLGGYFVLMQIVLIIQFIIHFLRNGGLLGLKDTLSWKQSTDISNNSNVSCESSGSVKQTTLVVMFPCGLLLLLYSLGPQQHSFDTGPWRGRTLLEEGKQDDPCNSSSLIIDYCDAKFVIGYILGWISAIIYFFSVPSQIIKNFKRKSSTGLSLTTFILIATGDVTYFMSIIFVSVDKIYIIRSLPWLVGTGWSVFFDVFLVIQIMVYRYLDKYHHPSKEMTIETTV